MPRRLTQEQVDAYARDGFLFPLDGIGADEARACRERLEAYEAAIGAPASSKLRVKAHLAFPWMVDLARDPRLLDVIEDLIGPDILLYLSALWAKDSDSERYVSWHQDSAYYGLEPHEEVTAWLALTPSTVESGCVKVIPGSHVGEDYAHVETYDEMNMLSRGQAIRGMDVDLAVDMILAPGQFSVHHEKLVHGSLPNMSGERRIGISFMYVPARVRSAVGRGAAILMRGRDPYDHWGADPEPRFDLDPVAMGAMKRAQDAYRNPERIPAGGLGTMSAREYAQRQTLGKVRGTGGG